MCSKPVKEPMRAFQISMPLSMIDKLDQRARENGTSRSEEIRNFTQLGFKQIEQSEKSND